MDLLDPGVYLWGQLSLLLSVSCKMVLSGDWTTGSSFAELKSPSALQIPDSYYENKKYLK